ncbi:hypothetical protein ABT010_05980 [Streptomyces sp. NPDC002668]|uniref:hypothetical protein n=1 Tax=Streptomyces sp. NPDC002668 TaxID=3154422 RepID=UPI0033280AE7
MAAGAPSSSALATHAATAARSLASFSTEPDSVPGSPLAGADGSVGVLKIAVGWSVPGSPLAGADGSAGVLKIAVGWSTPEAAAPGEAWRNTVSRGSRSPEVVSPDDFLCSDLSGDSPATVPP